MSARYEGTSNLSSSSSEDDDIFEAHRRLITQAIYRNNQVILKHLSEESNKGKHQGSIPGHIVINRNREAVDRNIFNDYFTKNPTYNAAMFRRRFRMGRNLFMRIFNEVSNHDNYFVQKRDGVGKLGLSDATDEYIKIGESTVIESVKRFCRAVVEVFGGQYLRSPNANDVARLLHIDPHSTKNKLFAMKQAACRKNVERAFGVLQSRFAIVARPSRFWQKNILHDIMTSCIIMHNMIIEDERDMNTSIVDQGEVSSVADVDTTVDDNTRFQEFLARYEGIKNKNAHFALRNALIEHLWEQFDNSDN
ncbi:uncharacterized protein LOC122013754 [Zingiber officinale]|uniref:uncharacterized protein LOC122013754 n=1 Tax=Zingiber officinale TaxID=94328 RepID=UPI001C4D395B|nr:uncharacterized protein LOC122013754 [Zingiber officinale]